MEARGDDLERRLLILAPFGKDAALIRAAMRGAADCTCHACSDFEVLVEELDRGAVAVLISEEALAAADDRLAAFIARQPPWSDLPILLLTSHGADSLTVARAMQTLGNVTLLERPVRVSTLVSAARSAIRARLRQYETRVHLHERDTESRRKDEFIATLAHELRNPLAPIRNAVYLLRDANVDPRIHDMLERQVVHIVRLVDDLLEVSRITHGKIELRKERIDIARVIDAAVETTRPLIEDAQVRLDVSYVAGSALVDADATRLAQVFSNLINNAVKYSEPGARISVDVRCDEGFAVVSVADTGMGIDAQTLPHVFDMFVQADTGGGRTQSGLGIGLTIARKLVEMHGGHLTAHSAGVGLGSTFVARLPLANTGGAQAASCASAHCAVSNALEEQRVLVVDDNRDAADSLASLVAAFGATVRVAYDGRSALQVVRDFRPGVVFLDLGMPGVDGFEVARRIRELDELRDIALVAVTGWGQKEDRRRTGAAGFDRHLVKPVDPIKLPAVLEAVARSRLPARPALHEPRGSTSISERRSSSVR
jgi:signal transduction histidine kinase/CheY-like chemotaxis protein